MAWTQNWMQHWTPYRTRLSMPPDIYRAIAKIRDAGFAQEAWPEALQSLTDALGVAGAACIVFNKNSERVDWICVSGLAAEFETAYIDHYAPLDPFAPLLSGDLDWMKLSESLSAPLLRRSEWYNDFVLACGVRDILGARLLDTQSHFVIFGLHQQIRRGFGDKIPLILKHMEQPLVSATLGHVENLFAAPTGNAGMQIVLEGTLITSMSVTVGTTRTKPGAYFRQTRTRLYMRDFWPRSSSRTGIGTALLSP
jgi:hypothetical protein